MLQLTIVGDLKSDNGQFQIGDAMKKRLQNSDVNVLNLEAPIKSSEFSLLLKSGPRLSQSKNVLDTIYGCGFRVISMANNHMMDFGKESLFYTKELIEEKECTSLGAGFWEDAYQIKCIETKGVKVGFLAVTQHEFGVLDDEQNDTEVGTAWMLHPYIDELILEGKKRCDYLFVLPHAGIENECFPLPELRTLYRHWIRMGADGVFASHPHTPQGWEIYEDKPICYSLGNFCFENHSQGLPKYWNNGLVAHVLIDEGKVQLDMHYVEYDQDKHYIDYTEEHSFCQHIDEINSVLKDEHLYIEKVNEYCNRLADYYDLAFAKGGYYKFATKKFSVQLLKQIVGKRYKGNINHALNNIRCEAHRWAIIRAWNNKIINGDVSI
ncbi:MAG: CapA family protein [Prevotella sp.]|nr:CapA family protein [Prevotella sp.]